MNTHKLYQRLSTVLELVMVVALLWAGVAIAAPQPALAADTITFSGRVLTTGSNVPISGVQIRLLSRLAGFDPPPPYNLVTSTTTTADGNYSITIDFALRTDYRLVESNLAGYFSTDAIPSAQGVKIDDDTIEFPYFQPNGGFLTFGVKTPNTFYDALRATITPTATATATRPPTSTPTWTPAPTRTPTRTPTQVATVDLSAYKIEVTQGVQDLNNSRHLVKDRRTFVRFYALSSAGLHATGAVLNVSGNGQSATLYPLNSPSIGTAAQRGVLSRSFLFELPAAYRQGTVNITAVVNPIAPPVYPARSPLETSYANNSTATTVSFTQVPTPKIVIYRVGYKLNGVTYWPALNDATMLASWLRRAYPAAAVNITYRTIWYGDAVRSGGDLIKPACGDINSLLAGQWVINVLFGGESGNTRYYGMVSDGGGFMRGCVPDIPSVVASGPTGASNWGWDFDGSYGDWYGGHELAHAYGRPHANFCGASGGTPPYPWSGGAISPSTVLAATNAIYGFDRASSSVLDPNWRDVMTYCDKQWVGGWTWEGLFSFFGANLTASPAALSAIQAMDRLRVTGWVDENGAVKLSPLFTVPNAPDANPPIPGNWAIVLRGAGGGELARYAFTPRPMHSGPDPNDPTELDLLLIDELVPYVPGTVRVDIEQGGTLKATISAGASTPTVTNVTPSGGTLAGDPITVAWTGADADPGDTLTYEVQFSRDNGSTWVTVASGLTVPTAAVDRANVASTTAGLFRVWASDGIHTGSGQSAAPFTIPNLPPLVQIVQPAGDLTIALGQTVALAGEVYDVDEGTLPDQQITWTSSRDGLLGSGAQLAVTTLSVGTHTITLRADDGHGGVTTDTVLVTVVATPAELPTPADQLLAGPPQILLAPALGQFTAELAVDNANAAHVVRWNAATSAAWIVLSAGSGETPANVTVSLNTGGLAAGTYNGTITLTSPDLPAQSVQIAVEARVSDVHKVLLPLLMK